MQAGHFCNDLRGSGKRVTRYFYQPHAIMLRQLREHKQSCVAIAEALGYGQMTVYRVSIGERLASQHMQRDIEQLWLEWRAKSGQGQTDKHAGVEQVAVDRASAVARNETASAEA